MLLSRTLNDLDEARAAGPRPPAAFGLQAVQ